MKTPVYLDYNASTPVDKRVLEKMLPFFSEQFGNAHSKTHSYGWFAEEAVMQARNQVAQLINAEPGEIVFTSGATESINLAIKGVYANYHKKGNHIIAVASEHKAVLDCLATVNKQGAEITYLNVNREGLIDIDELKKSFKQSTILVCVMLANNETGVIQNISSLAEIVHQNNAILLSDATQALAKIRVDVQDLGVDLMPISAHKIYGPKGAGALFVRRKNPRVSLQAIIDGGGHENGLRSGTLNVPGIVGLGEACELAENELWKDSILLSRLRTKFEQSLIDLGNIFVNGSQKHRLPNVSNLMFTGIKADRLIAKLPSLAFSTGSACTAALPEPSHVLKAMGLSSDEAYSSARFSFGRFSTEEEVDFAVEKISAALKEL